MNNLKQWFNYFSKNKKALKELNKIENNGNINAFNLPLKTHNNVFYGIPGYGYNKFNEITIKAITKAYLSFFLHKLRKNENYKKLNILVCSSLEFDKDNNLLNFILETLNGHNINTYCFDNYFLVNKQFLQFSIQKIAKLDGCIYISEYNNIGDISIEFLDNNGNRISNDDFLIINEILSKLDFFDIKSFKDIPNFINLNILLDEYAEYILKFNYNFLSNKPLKVGIFSKGNTNKLVTKILGWNDISYSFIKDKNISYDKYLKNIYLRPSFDYVIRFSPKSDKVYLYQRIKKGLLNKYILINSNTLNLVYLNYINHGLPTNSKYEQTKNIFISPCLDTNAFQKLSVKRNLQFAFDIKDNNELEKLEDNNIYFSEDHKLYIKNKLIRSSDSILMLSIFCDMLNYFSTQNKTLLEVFYELNKGNEKLIFNEFSFPISQANLESFETKMNVQDDSIASLLVTEKVDLRKHSDETTKYISKLNLSETEIILIKYSYEYSSIIVNVIETEKTRGNIYKRIKAFFKKFLRGYDTDLLQDITDHITIELENAYLDKEE